MKKLFALALVVLGLAACQTEPNELDVNVGGEVLTTVNISIPETTRSNSAEGAFENLDLINSDLTIRYILQVYYNGKPSKERLVKYSDDMSVAFNIRLAPGRDYNFVVWADLVEGNDFQENVWSNNDGLHYNTENLHNITLKRTWVAMDETRDAFTGYYNTADHGVKYSGSLPINLTLKRPFAKLRVKTTDMVALDNIGIVPYKGTVIYTTKHRESFNACNGTYGEQTKEAVTLTYNIASYEDNDTHSKVVFTDYFFANEDVVKFTMDIMEADGSSIKFNNFSTDIPVKRNFLTTISGNILTDGNNVKVDIVDAFDGEKNWPDENESAEQLAYAAMFGGEVTLTDNVTLTEPLTIAEGANAVINLNGKTISNATGYAVENYGKLTISGNGAVNGMGGIRSHGGEVTINGGTYTGASKWNEGTYQHILKAENTKVVINGGTFDATIQGTNNAMINVSENSVVTINGGEFRNVVDGEVIPQFAPYMFTYEKNGKLIINDGEFYGGWRFNGETTTTDIYGGNFTVSYDGQSFHATSTHELTVYGGTFSLENGGKLNPTNYCATGYKAIAADGIYYVLSETIANVAEAEGVTAVTESTADVATALATNNSEATLFMWNDVAYIAKYGEVVIFSDADEATTVRGVVESSTGLTSATVKDGIEVVGNRTFRKCANLETVALPKTLTEIGPAVFQSCSKLANITIPESVTTIGEGAFAECTALTSINIPAGVTRLEKDVLRNTGLVSVEIPASVNYIGTFAFRDCESLTEIKILSPEFTIENNTFTNTAAPVPTMTIHVVNDEMKAYLESILTNYDKSYITVVGPKSVASKEDLPVENGKLDTNFDEDVNLYGDITVSANETNANSGYGATGVTVTDGAVLNGQGHTLTVNNAWGTWDCVVAAKGGTIKNLTVSSAMRGIFMPGANGDVYIDNVIFDNVIYTFNSDAGNKNYGVYISNSTLNGWTSFSDVHKEVVFTNCSFGNGNGYAFCRPYNACVFEDCEFSTDMEFDTTKQANIVFKNCTYGGVKITAENAASLKTGDVTFFYNGVGSVSFK